MGGKEPLISFETLLSDVLKGVAGIQKMVEELNRNLISSQESQKESIISRLEQMETYFQSMKETTELLNELLAELRILVPTLHINKLIEEVKSAGLQVKKEASPVAEKFRDFSDEAAYNIQTRTSQKPVTAPAEAESPFSQPPALEPSVQETASEKKEPDVVYSSKVPSYVKEKKKPKSIWAGIRDEEEQVQ